MELLQKLCAIPAPSGREEALREYIKGELVSCADEITEDALGNLIVHKKGTGEKVMFAAHMDEIGVIVTFVDDNGFLRFAPVGGVDPYDCVHREVIFVNGVRGVISYEEKEKPLKDLDFKKLFIDIGARSREEAETLISVGDTGVFAGGFFVQGDTVTAKALDDRAGCYVLIRALKECGRTDKDIYAVFTAQEEVGLRGARVAAERIAPEWAYAVDVTDTGDMPEAERMAVALGKGPAVKVKDRSILTHPLARQRMFDAAEAAGVPYQLEILECGGTDAGAIHLTGFGVKTGALSIPTRYIHSVCETADIKDIQNSVALLCALMR